MKVDTREYVAAREWLDKSLLIARGEKRQPLGALAAASISIAWGLLALTRAVTDAAHDARMDALEAKAPHRRWFR